ncbi:MAG: hypothetical protein ACP5D7_06865 [Limnospira sp.]
MYHKVALEGRGFRPNLGVSYWATILSLDFSGFQNHIDRLGNSGRPRKLAIAILATGPGIGVQYGAIRSSANSPPIADLTTEERGLNPEVLGYFLERSNLRGCQMSPVSTRL